MTLDRPSRIARWAVLALLAACDPGGPGPAGDATADAAPEPDAAPLADAAPDAAPAPTNAARVFAVDPLTTPEPILVDLASVADDQGGVLTSAARPDGVRRIAAVSCVDEGATNHPMGLPEQRTCTLRPLASKEANGSFLYDDWAEDVACGFAPENRHAEVNLYYHVDRIYDLVTAPEVGVFDLLPGRHDVDGAPVPLTVVASYRAPAPVDATALAPFLGAYFLPREYLAMGMAVYEGLPGVPGDVLVFGQAETVDFAYAAETVYHEFGHAVVNATAALGQVFADDQGLTNQPRALDEAFANTLAFLGSDEPVLGEFLTGCSGYGFTFETEVADRFPEDLTGHPVVDGNAVLGAHHALYRAFVDAWGGTRAGFVRVLLLALLDLAQLEGNATFADWSAALLDRLASEGHADHLDAAAAILDAHGLRQTDREVDLTGAVPADGRYLALDCAAEEPWNTGMVADLGGGPVPLATAYVRHRVTAAADATEIAISARLAEKHWARSGGSDWDYRLVVRRDGPVSWSYDGEGVASAVHDAVLAPVITPGEGGDPDLATWTIAGLDAGATVHLQVVNLGASEGILAALEVQ